MFKSICIIIFFILILIAGSYFYKKTTQKVPADKSMSIGQRFHYETNQIWHNVVTRAFRKVWPIKAYKEYPDAELIKLPKPEYRGITVEEALLKRRSRRNYSDKPLSIAYLSQLIFAAGGITSESGGRTAPAAGGNHSIEIYMIVNNVEGLEPGIYHYAVKQHSLEKIKSGNYSKYVIRSGSAQAMLGEADVTFVLAAVFDRIRQKYGERSFRYAYMEAGHVSQNIYLQAVSLGVGSVCVGEFFDEKVSELIGIDGIDEAVIYLHAVGTL
jgi:SagB-type dehydrogenase family enzyme